MILKSGKWFGWLAGLALVPVVGWSQFKEHPQNTTVCVGEKAYFRSIGEGITIALLWYVDGIDFRTIAGVGSASDQIVGGELIAKFTLNYNKEYNGSRIQSHKFIANEFSLPAYVFYKSSQQYKATNLTATVDQAAIHVNWDAFESNYSSSYLVSVSSAAGGNAETDAGIETPTPFVVSSTHYDYYPDPQYCQVYAIMVSAYECPDPSGGITQTISSTVIVLYPTIAPVSTELSGQTVLVSWVPDSGSIYLVSFTDMDRGDQTRVIYDGTPPFSYTPKICGQLINLNVSVSPVRCVGKPAFTHSDTISFTIDCPDQPSGTQANYPSLLLTVAATIPLLKWQH